MVNDFLASTKGLQARRYSIPRLRKHITPRFGCYALKAHRSALSVGAGASLGLPIIGKLLGHKQANLHRPWCPRAL
jgi:hypothetical protein